MPSASADRPPAGGLARPAGDPTPSAKRRDRHWPATIAALLLALFGWMAASVSDEHSTTADEIFHLTAGYAYWKTGDFRLHAENGHFPQRWAALPLLAQEVAFPSRAQPAWQNADAAEIGFQFFYEKGNDLARLLRTARAMNTLLGIALGALVFAWSRALFGPKGGLVSAAVFAFCPHLLAHAGLVTSDIAACLGFVAAVLTSWRLLHRVTPGRLLAAGGAFGLLALAKFSAVLLAPMLVLLIATRAWRRAPLPVRLGPWHNRLRGVRVVLALVIAHAAAAALAVGIIWAAFGFRFAGAPAISDAPPAYNQPWGRFFGADGAHPTPASVPMRVSKLALDLRLLPEAYLYGFVHTLHFADGRPAFFMGEYRSTGWREFFPTAFLLKTTPSVFALLGIAGWLILRRRAVRSRLVYRLTPLVILLAVYWSFAVTSHLNIGHRHILVTYPVLAICIGGIALGFRRKILIAISLPLLVAQAATSWHIRPHYLAYFNPLLGGPSQAYRHFVDSSLDWGQDLPGLARWLAANTRGEKVFLSYFGSGSPAYHGIKATRLADGFFDLRTREVLPAMTGGIYCLSATMFQQPYTMVRHGWTANHERRYAELNRWAVAWRAGQDPTARETAVSQLVELEHLRFGRLCAGLASRPPDHLIGYSILVFRLGAAEVRHLLEGPPPVVP